MWEDTHNLKTKALGHQTSANEKQVTFYHISTIYLCLMPNVSAINGAAFSRKVHRALQWKSADVFGPCWKNKWRLMGSSNTEITQGSKRAQRSNLLEINITCINVAFCCTQLDSELQYQTYVSALLPWFSHQAHSSSSFAKLKENKVKVLENCAFGTNRKDFLYLSLGI